MLVIGDLHLNQNWIKRSQVEKFFEWLVEQKCFIEEKNIILLGDLFEVPVPSVSLVVYYLKLFSEICKDKTIYILEGNHDHNLTENALDYFQVLKNVKLIKELSELTIEDKKCLFLPDYDHEGTDKLPMQKAYSNLQGKYDFIFAHVMDETQNFGESTFCNLKNVQGLRLFGHVHTPTVLDGGSYLGSVVKNSSTEKTDQKLLALCRNSRVEYIKVPSFLEYETLEYGTEPENKEKLVLINVTGAPTRADAEDFYEKRFSNVMLNKVTTKRQLALAAESLEEVSETASWEAFSKEKNLSESVDTICKQLF